MKVLLAFSIMSLWVRLCAAQTTNPTAGAIDLEGSITVHIQFDPSITAAQVRMEIYHTFPSRDYSSIRDSLSSGKRQIWLECPVRTIGLASLFLTNSSLSLLVSPGDTIHISVKAVDSSEHAEKLAITFSGKTKTLQEYYHAKQAHLPELQQRIWHLGLNASDLNSFQQSTESALKQEKLFLDGYAKQHPLPDWFVEYETASTNYYYAWVQLYVAMYHIDYKKTLPATPDGYYTFLDNVKIQNESALYNYEYMRFLREYLFWHMKTTQQTPPDYLLYAKQLLSQKVGDFFEVWESSASADNPEVIGYKSKRTFSESYHYLIDYLIKRSQNGMQLLKPGDKAPAFALVDGNDSLFTLNQFKGKVVYLSFWFASCGGCIQEFPYENKLVEQFRDKPFQVISICVPTPGIADELQLEKWQMTSKRFGLKTLDLFANKAWAQPLKEKYFVNAFPHYVLIDDEGKIITNFAPRPSGGAANLIKKALEKKY